MHLKFSLNKHDEPIGTKIHHVIVLASLAILISLIPNVFPAPVLADPVQPTGKIDIPNAGPIQFAPPTLVDLDGDQTDEILVGTSDGKILALDRIGNTLSQRWLYDTSTVLGSPTTIRGAISAGDLDGDGMVEVVTPVGDVFATNSYGGLVVLDSDGKLQWYYRTYDHTGEPQPGVLGPDGRSDGIFGAPALGDLDNDGDLEIVFGSIDHRIYVFHHDGTIAFGWPRFVRDTVWPSPALADLDNDGLLEIVIGIDTHKEGFPFNTPDGGALQVYRGNGELVWEKFINQVIYSSPAVGDLDGDGDYEIVHGTGDFFRHAEGIADGNKIWAWDAKGNQIWTGVTGGFTFGSPALGNLDSDPQLEVVASSADRRIFTWKHDGSPLWNQTPTNFQGNTMELRGSPALADFNNDGAMDVFVNIFWDAAILNGSNGVQLTANSFPNNPNPAYVSGYTVSDNAPGLGDLDGNGTLELILASADNTGSHAQVVFWDSIVASKDKAPWPMFGQNAQHTNLYPHTRQLDSLVAGHNVPEVMAPGEQVNATITFKNTGSDAWRTAARSGVAGPIVLAPVNGPDPLDGPARIPVRAETAPGQDATFTVGLTAPSQDGYYIAYWRLKDEASGKFFGRAVKVEVKVGNQPALHVLTSQGFKAGGLATQALPGTNQPPTDPFTNWPAALAFKLNHDKRGYYLLDSFGGFWYGGQTYPLPSAGSGTDRKDLILGPDAISYYLLRDNGAIIGCNADGCTLGFNPAPPTNIQARSFALSVTTDPQEAKQATGVYVLDAFGNVYTGGAAPALIPPAGLPVQEDIFVRIKLAADGKGYYLLDKYGRIWNGGSAPALEPNYTPQIGQDWARDFELTDDEKGFYMLDKDGKIYSGGDAPELTVNVPASGPDIGRDLELVDTRTSSAPNVALSATEIGRLVLQGTTDALDVPIVLTNRGSHKVTWNASASLPARAKISLVPPNGSLDPGASTTVTARITGLASESKDIVKATVLFNFTSASGGGTVQKQATINIHIVDQIYFSYLPQLAR